MALFDDILKARGLDGDSARAFLCPDYDIEKGDPYLLPDMDRAVNRLKLAHQNGDKVVIYGDYDVDGLSATALLLDAFDSFKFKEVDYFIPNRFVEGYGLTIGAVDKLKEMNADLVVTVDCGSLSHIEIEYANSLGMDVIVTDHHNVADTPPPAIASVNPRFDHNKYPFRDLAGVGVAFKLVQALQQELDGLPIGYEKWLLDLVALGTVCDIVKLTGENRANVYWGLEVMKKTRRKGIKALLAVAGVDGVDITSKTLGFVLGPRINAAGRLKTASYALDVLIASDSESALERAQYIDNLNTERRDIQNAIYDEANQIAHKYKNDKVLVISGKGWNHGVIGIVAAKILESHKKPVYILEEGEDGRAKGSARSYGDFSAADAIRYADDIIIKGGGHAAAAGVTLEVDKIADFRTKVNEFYNKVTKGDQLKFLLPREDVVIDSFGELDEELVNNIAKLEPFGNANPEPVLKCINVKVVRARRIGADGSHLKLRLCDAGGGMFDFLAFSAPDEWFFEDGDVVNVWFTLDINEWNGMRNVEGRLLHAELVN